MTYNYVVTSQRPTAVSHAVVCSFTGPEARNLILSKGNRIEVHAAAADSIAPVTEFGIYGNVSSLNYYRPSGMQQDVLFILTAKKYFCVLGFDAANGTIVNRAVGCLRDRVGRDCDHGPAALLDPAHRMIAMSLYERHLKIIPIETNGMREAYNVRVDELKAIDFKFLHGFDKPTLCQLYEDNRGSRHLSTFTVDSRTKSLLPGPWKLKNVDPESTLLLPVQAPMKGVVVFARTSISYVSGGAAAGAANTQTLGVKPMFVTSVGRIDEGGTRYAVGDDKGNLYVLVLVCSGGTVSSLALEYLGCTAICTALCHLGDGLMFVGSCLTDSQLIRLRPHEERDNTTEASPVVEVVSTYMNIGPILDMAVVKKAGNGQAQIVTCSGALRDGSLRVVRSGIGLHEQASVDIEGIKRMWSLRANDASPFDTALVQSFSRETRVLCIEDEELSEGCIPGFKTDVPTLYCGNMAGNVVVQVTPSDVTVVSRESSQTVFSFPCPSRVTVAEGNMRQLVIATTSSEVIYFECTDGVVSLVSRVTLDHDVACMSMKALPFFASTASAASGAIMPPAPPTVEAEQSVLHPMGKALVLAVGMWTDGTVRLLSLPSLEEVSRVSLGTDVQVRDVLIMHHVEAAALAGGMASKVNFASFLLAGLGDGCVISYSLGMNPAGRVFDVVEVSSGNSVSAEELEGLQAGAEYCMHSRRRVALGSRPIAFSSFVVSGNKLCAFAACDRPTVIYVNSWQLQFSLVNASEAGAMSPFNCEMFPECLAISSDDSLMVCNLDTIQKVHVEKIELEEDPHHICYAPNHAVYGVLSSTVGSAPPAVGTNDSDAQWASHQVSFFDTDLQRIFTHALDPLENGLSVHCCNLLDPAHGEEGSQANQREYIVVGTAYAVPGESEPSRGRILVFKLDRFGGGGGNGGTVAVDYDNIDDHAMSVKEGDDGAGLIRVSLVSERDTNGAVLSLTSLKGRLVAGINSKLQVFKWTDGADNISVPELKSECGHHGHLLALLLKARGDVLALGDILQSITMINFNEESSKLEEIARDFTCNYMRAIEILDNNTFIGAEDNENLFFVHRDLSGKSVDSGRLEVCGEFHVGELVNTFQHGTLSNRPVEQSAGQTSEGEEPLVLFTGSTQQSVLFGTVSGAIGTILGIDESTYNLFRSLQKCIQTVVHSVGGLPHADWRNFANDKKYGTQSNSVDGDLVEMFLELTPAEMSRVVSLLKDDLCTGAVDCLEDITVETIRSRIEEISRCH